ncbi:restriction endonuclease subunit S [Pseudomonas mohnii]
MSELPKGWQIVSLGEIGYVQSGIGFPNEYQGLTSGDYPVYKVGDVSRSVTQNNGKLQSANNYVTSDTAKLLKGQIFEAGSTLFAKIGEALKLNRRGFVVRAGLADNNVMGYTPEENVNNLFIHYFLRTQDFAEYSRSTTIPSIRKGDIEEIRLALPPSHEQTRIAQKLDELLAQVDTLKARIDAIPVLLKRFRQSVLTAAVSGQLTEEWRTTNTPPHVSVDVVKKAWRTIYSVLGKRYKDADLQPGKLEYLLPTSWAETKIGEIFDVYVGATPNRNTETYWGGAIPWVSSSEVSFCRIKSTKELITEEGYKSTSTTIHPAGTVMLAMIGQGKTRGQPAILDIDACHNQNTAAIRVHCDYCVPEFLYYFLYERYEETRRVGSGNNQQALNKKSVQSLPFPFPPLAEQTEIVRRVEQLFAFADQLEAKVASAKTRIDHLTQSILAKAFRGELVPQDPNDEPASVLLERIKAQRAAAPKAKRGRKASV